MAAPIAGPCTETPEAVFERLYAEHRQTLHAYFLGRTGDPELALDLLQEAFTRAWRGVDRLQVMATDRRRFWLFTVARNLVTDHYRGRAVRAATHGALTASATRDGRISDNPEAAVERDQALRLVDEAIRRLPAELRTVLLLQVLGEHTSAEIGEMLDRPAGTVRYQLSRARKRLAEELRLLDGPLDPARERET